jgi:hypothetical protein
MKKSPKIQRFLLGFIAFLVCIWPALYNNFPLTTPDSGGYIFSGIKLTLAKERPWGYGIFILLTSMGISLWWVIFAQAAIFVALLQSLCKKLLGKNASPFLNTTVILIISFVTSAAWFTSQLMAYAFTGILLIAIILFFLEKENRKKLRILGALIFFILMMHTSHVLVTALLSAIAVFFYHKRRMKTYFIRARQLLVLSLSSLFLIAFMYFVGGYGFRLSPVSHIFVMSRMAENGILDQYLK